MIHSRANPSQEAGVKPEGITALSMDMPSGGAYEG